MLVSMILLILMWSSPTWSTVSHLSSTTLWRREPLLNNLLECLPWTTLLRTPVWKIPDFLYRFFFTLPLNIIDMIFNFFFSFRWNDWQTYHYLQQNQTGSHHWWTHWDHLWCCCSLNWARIDKEQMLLNNSEDLSSMYTRRICLHLQYRPCLYEIWIFNVLKIPSNVEPGE